MKKLLYFSAIGAFINFSLVSGMEMPVKTQKEPKPSTTFQDLPNDMVIELARGAINWNGKNQNEIFGTAIALLSTNKYFNDTLKPRFL